MMPGRHAIQIVLPLLIATVAGCGSVRPGADFHRAGQLIAQRTGTEVAYDPQAESAIEERISGWLRDGLTADEAVQIALLNNKGFQSLFQEIGVTKADLVQSALLSNPSLSFSARFPEGGGRANLSFGLAQEIAELWQIPVRKRIARDQLDQAIFRVVMSAIDLAAETRQTYIKLQVLELSEKVLEDSVSLLTRTQDTAKGRFQAGETSILDVNLVRSNAFDATMRLVSLRGDVRMARADLTRLLGLANGVPEFQLTGSLDPPETDIPDEAALLDQALQNRVDIRLAAADLDAAEGAISQQRRARIPSIVLGIDGERPDARAPRSLKPIPQNPGRPDLSGVAASQTINEAIAQLAQVQQTQRQALGQSAKDLLSQEFGAWRDRQLEKRQRIDLLLGPSIQITLPIWDQNRAQISKAEFQYIQKQKDYADMVLGVIQDVKKSVATLETTRDMLRLAEDQALPLAEQNVGTAQRVYQAGEDSILTLLVAQQSFNNQRESQIKLKGEYAIALANLERAVGGRSNGGGAITASESEVKTPL